MDDGRTITRRALLQGASAATAAAALSQLVACSSADEPDALPNVLVVLADDMRADFLQYAPEVGRRLVDGGRTFTAARTNVSLCQPFRVGLLTGQRSKRHLILGNGDTSRVPHDNLLGKWVQDAGYRTALIGKYLNGAPPMTPKPAGWSTWRQILGDSDPASYDRTGYAVHDGETTTRPAAPQLDYLRDEVLAFVEGSEPWFCLMTPTSPHFPFEPEPEDADALPDLVLEVPDDPNVGSKPWWYASRPPLGPALRAEFQEIARRQAQEIRGLDRVLGEILDALPPAVLERTLVVFSSDDGLNYGEHRSPYAGASKNDFYDHNLLVPLVCHGPGFADGTSGEPVSPEIDLARTIIELTGATAGLDIDGADLRQVQDRPGRFADRHLLHERGPGGLNNPNPVAGLCVSNATRKLMRWTGQTGTDRYEAYDLDEDPHELVNWASDPDRRAERDRLEAELDRLSPPPERTPTLLFASEVVADTTELTTDDLDPDFHAVLVIDVFAGRRGDVGDPTVAGDCIDMLEPLAHDERVGADGARRRLVSYRARATGTAGPITITAATGQTLDALSATVTQYRYQTAVVQSVAAGGAGSTSFEATLGEPQQPGNAAHFSVLTDGAPLESGGSAEVLHQGSAAGTATAIAFATLWSDEPPVVAGSAPAGSWSLVASEIGT